MATCVHCAVSNEPVFLCMHSYIKFKDKIGRSTYMKERKLERVRNAVLRDFWTSQVG